MTEIHLDAALCELWAGEDVFAKVFALEGEDIRSVNGRSTIKTLIAGKSYYVKRHRGVRFREIVKNWLSLRQPIVDASNEYVAIGALRAAGINTLEVAAYGCETGFATRRRSFLVTRELAPIQSLEQYCLRWPEVPPAPKLKWALIEHVARIARVMHKLGFNHRDFYICHFLLLYPQVLAPDNAAQARLYLVDLHRALSFDSVPRRWLVKDLGSLLFSTYEIGLTRRDLLRFLRIYFADDDESGGSLRTLLERNGKLLSACRARADTLYVSANRKRILPRQLAGLPPPDVRFGPD